MTRHLRCEYCGTKNAHTNPHCTSCGAVLPLSAPPPTASSPRAVSSSPETAPTSFAQKVLALCRPFEAHAQCHTIETIPPQKLANAVAAFGIPADGRPLFLYDDTVFGSFKRGFAICEAGIYWKNSWHTPTKRTRLSWPAFAEREIRMEDLVLELGRGDRISIATWPDEDVSQVRDFLRALQALRENKT